MICYRCGIPVEGEAGMVMANTGGRAYKRLDLCNSCTTEVRGDMQSHRISLLSAQATLKATGGPSESKHHWLGSAGDAHRAEAPWPCRISENERVVHCDSCEQAPELLARIRRLEAAFIAAYRYIHGGQDRGQESEERYTAWIEARDAVPKSLR